LLPDGLEHMLIDERGLIKKSEYAPLAKWTASSDLGRLILDVNNEFNRNEPVYRSGYAALPSYSQSIKSDPIRNQNSNINDKPRSSINNFPEVDKLSLDEMKALVNDESKFSEFVNTIESISTSTNLKKEFMSSNTETREKITACQDELKSL